MSQPRTALLAVLVLGGCTVAPANVADRAAPPVGYVPEAHDGWQGGDPRLDPDCLDGGHHTLHNPGFPAHQVGLTCAAGGGFELEDAIAACGGPVKYFSTACDDFPASAPYQHEDERTWTSYVGCCAGDDPGPGPEDHGGPPGLGHGPWSGPGPGVALPAPASHDGDPKPGHGTESGKGTGSHHGDSPRPPPT